MRKTVLLIALAVLILVSAAACRSDSPSVGPLPTSNLPSASPTPRPTATRTAEPTMVATPTQTAPPSPTAFPTPPENAPEVAFTSVGSSARLEGSHEIAGKAVLAGLQTLIIQGFTFDGKGSSPDVRLVLGDDVENPAAILVQLESRRYDQEMVFSHVPSSVTADTADSIAIYNPETKETYALAKFE